jgi:hypothetical protein
MDGKGPEALDYVVYDYADSLAPGKDMKIDRSLYLSSGDIKGPIESGADAVLAKYEESARREKEVYEALREQARAWGKQAANTALLKWALDYLQAPCTTHSANVWESGENRSEEISNMVYQMWMRIYEETCYDKGSKMSVPVAWHVSWQVTLNTPLYSHRTTIHSQHNKRFRDKGRMERYVAGRKKAFAHLFCEASPPIPKELADCFKVHGLLLPGYREKPEEGES